MRILKLILVALLLSAPASAINITQTLNPGWNPVAFQGTTVTSINATGVAGMATFAGSYTLVPVTLDNVNVGEGTFRGFWIFNTVPGSLNYVADENTKQLAINLQTGWNLVSFATSSNTQVTSLTVFEGLGQVPLASILLTQFYQIQPNGSSVPVNVSDQVSELVPGRPYWVFALRPCQLRYVPLNR
jgi:hypothetical protein